MDSLSYLPKISPIIVFTNIPPEDKNHFIVESQITTALSDYFNLQWHYCGLLKRRLRWISQRARGLFSPLPLAMFGLMWLCSYGEPSQVTLRFSEVITILYVQRHEVCLKSRHTNDWFAEIPQSWSRLKSSLKRKTHPKIDITQHQCSDLGFYHHVQTDGCLRKPAFRALKL